MSTAPDSQRGVWEVPGRGRSGERLLVLLDRAGRWVTPPVTVPAGNCRAIAAQLQEFLEAISAGCPPQTDDLQLREVMVAAGRSIREREVVAC